MPTILVVEDDKNSGYLVKRNLVQAGYDVLLAADGEEAITQINNVDIDLCIFDIMLPKKDGLTLAREVRDKDRRIPFIFLSARSLAEDRIEGFKAGCDDYITKPFNLEELLLRINVVLNRRAPHTRDDLRECPVVLGDSSFNHRERVLYVGNHQHNLSLKESDLLKILVLNRNEVISRSQILLYVWGKDDYYASKSMDVYLTKIRKLTKMIDGVELQNIHGYGYKLRVSA